MKNQFLILLLIIVTGAYSRAQTGNDLQIQPLLNLAETKYKELVEKSNKTIERFEIDIVSQSSDKYTPIRLISGKIYSIVLLIETEIVTEFELKIYSTLDKTRVLKNEVNNPARIIETTFKPERTDYYEFEIIARKFSGGNKSGRYCLIIAS
jgi:hypothetical protein